MVMEEAIASAVILPSSTDPGVQLAIWPLSNYERSRKANLQIATALADGWQLPLHCRRGLDRDRPWRIHEPRSAVASTVGPPGGFDAGDAAEHGAAQHARGARVCAPLEPDRLTCCVEAGITSPSRYSTRAFGSTSKPPNVKQLPQMIG